MLPGSEATHVDVLVVGAGFADIGAAYHLQDKCPDHSFVVLEGADMFGGTWRIHRYPGTRSDPDLHTFGYEFKPWLGTPIALRRPILEYLGEVISENELDRHIRYNHQVRTAVWSSEEARWTLSGNTAGTSGAADETFRAARNRSDMADQLRSLDIPEEWIHEIERRRMLRDGQAFTELCFSDPEAAKEQLRNNIAEHLRPDLHHLIDQHFTPKYLPWRERLAVVPDGDLFGAINEGKASVVTDHIASFTERGKYYRMSG